MTFFSHREGVKKGTNRHRDVKLQVKGRKRAGCGRNRGQLTLTERGQCKMGKQQKLVLKKLAGRSGS